MDKAPLCGVLVYRITAPAHAGGAFMAPSTDRPSSGVEDRAVAQARRVLESA